MYSFMRISLSQSRPTVGITRVWAEGRIAVETEETSSQKHAKKRGDSHTSGACLVSQHELTGPTPR